MIVESLMEAHEEGQRKRAAYKRANERSREAADAAFATLPLAGTTRECPKCLFGMLTYRYTTCYWADGWTTENRYREYLLVVVPERGLLVRTCPQCSAELFERPADSVADYEEPTDVGAD